MKAKKFNAGENIQVKNAQWNFSAAAKNFNEHVRKSIPLYEQGHQYIAQLASFFLRDKVIVYEIGCSAGQLGATLLKQNPDKKYTYIGIDNVPEMVAQARSCLRDDKRARVVLADAVTYDYQPACLFISYYTLQFINPCVRQDLLKKIYQILDWGGAAIIYEKVRGPDARFQDILTQLYTDFKLAGGFNESEIVHKTRSLKGVLEPFSTAGNLDLLKRAGFVDIMIIHKCLCFEGYLCIK